MKKVWIIKLPEHLINGSKNVSDKQKESETSQKSNISSGSGFGVRHLQCMLMFFGLTVAYTMRVNLSVAIVAMTNSNSTNPDFEEYDWDEKTKSIILSSFFWGYIVTQVPGGAISQRYGAKFTIFTGVLVCSITTIFTPLCASLGGWKLICGIRLVQGLCQGLIFPSTHVFLSKWAPVEERGRLGTYTYSGTQFGTVSMMAASGLIASSWLGWPGIFYISGCSGILWCLIWVCLGASRPSDYTRISPEERKFIETSLGHSEEAPKHLKTPWLKIVTSVPFLALLVVHSAYNWGFWTLMTEMPSYMKGALEQDIKANALLSALPYTAMMFLSYFFSFLSDLLQRHQCMSLTVSRKVFNSIGTWIPAAALIALGYITKENTSVAIILLVIAVGMTSATYLGFQVNHIDLAPNFAGPMMGITNCLANVMGIVAPLFVGFIVSNEHDVSQWRAVFFISAGIYFFGNLLFVLFGKTATQPWNDPDYRSQANSRRTSEAAERAESPY